MPPRALAPKRRARHLGLAEFEPVVQVHRHEVWRAGHRILDRLDFGLQHAGDQKTPLSALEIPFELEIREDRVRLVLDRRTVDREAGRRLLLLAAHDLEKRLDLRFGGGLVDDAPPRALAFVDRARPAVGARHP